MASASPGMSRRIKNALKAILAGLQYGGEPAFVQVLDSTKGEFESYPSVRILPSNFTSEDLDSADRDHTVEFAAILHFLLGTSDDIESDLFDSMLDLTDLIANALEHADQSGQLSQIDPAIQSWMMNVPNARWYVGQSKAGALLLCNLTIRISYSQSAV